MFVLHYNLATGEEYKNISRTCRSGDRKAKAQPALRSTVEEEQDARYHLHQLGVHKPWGPDKGIPRC